jgi:hypothetical protein
MAPPMATTAAERKRESFTGCSCPWRNLVQRAGCAETDKGYGVWIGPLDDTSMTSA